MRDDAPYYVWTRSDGYHGCTRYKPWNYAGWTYTHLLTTDSWIEARGLLVSLRFPEGE